MTKARMIFLLVMLSIIASYAGWFCMFRPGGLSDGGFW
jgi:hypothetical protein